MLIIVLIFLLIAFQFLGYWGKLPERLQVWFDTQQEKEKVPEGQHEYLNSINYWEPSSKRNVATMYVYFAGWLMRFSRRDLRGKVQFVHSYLNRYFRGAGNFAEEMSEALRYKVDTASLVRWIQRTMRQPEDKCALLTFLISLALEDGDVTREEFDAIVDLGIQIDIDRGETEHLIKTLREARKKNYEYQSRPSVNDPAEDRRIRALKILELSEEANDAAVKKAYRQLAKLYHPDLYALESQTIQEVAAARFREIREAYELLTR